MAQKSFLEILGDQIRTDLQAQLRTELQAKNPEQPDQQAGHRASIQADIDRLQNRIWLDSQITSRPGLRQPPHSAYNRPTRPKTKPEIRPEVQPQTPQQVLSLELLCRLADRTVPETLSERSLKSIWRQAVFRNHPDRFRTVDTDSMAKINAKFRELVVAHQVLKGLFRAS